MPNSHFIETKHCFERQGSPKDDIKGVIIHYVSARYTQPNFPYDIAEIARILDRYKCSYHGIIGLGGEIFSMVSINHIAYHAGISRFFNYRDFNVNVHTIGYAYLGVYEQPPTEFQYKTLTNLCRVDMKTFVFKPNCILGHDQIAGDNMRGKGKGKTDPGPNFDWVHFYNLLCRE